MSSKIYTGKRGGKYYLSNGKKVYIKSKQSPKKSPRGCNLQSTKKYVARRSPAYPANECCGMIKTRYNVSWKSVPDKNGVCKWQKL